jgi:serine/threonine protein kinase
MLLNIAAALVDHVRKKREGKRAFLENGGLVLEKLVASCNGRPFPIRTFSYQQLILATNNFEHPLYSDAAFYTMYKGSFEGRILSIKMYYERNSSAKDLALMDMGISAKTSAHKNILKLVGCCLETSIPSLVFEYAQNGILDNRIFISTRQGTPMLWQSRLKIARQFAHAIAYLHTAFFRPIIHADIKMKNILLDQHDVPKLADFALSVSIPEGETHVQADVVRGTTSVICPHYYSTGRITEKTDVYNYGMVLLQILTGQRMLFLDREDEDCSLLDRLRNRAINEIVDPAILSEEGGAGLGQQLQAVWVLGLTCIEDDPEIRPTMVDVTKELRQIERSTARFFSHLLS